MTVCVTTIEPNIKLYIETIHAKLDSSLLNVQRFLVRYESMIDCVCLSALIPFGFSAVVVICCYIFLPLSSLCLYLCLCLAHSVCVHCSPRNAVYSKI